MQPHMSFGTVENLCATYRPAIRALAVVDFGEADADEIAQECMLRALADVDRLARPAGRWRWLVELVDQIGDELAARDAEREDYEVALAAQPPGGDETSSETLTRDLRRRLEAAWAGMNLVDRRALALQEIIGLTPAETALQCGTTANAIRQRTFRARRFLRDELDPQD